MVSWGRKAQVLARKGMDIFPETIRPDAES